MTARLGSARFAEWSRRPAVHVTAVLLTFQASSVAYVFFVLDTAEIVPFFSALLTIGS